MSLKSVEERRCLCLGSLGKSGERTRSIGHALTAKTARETERERHRGMGREREKERERVRDLEEWAVRESETERRLLCPRIQKSYTANIMRVSFWIFVDPTLVSHIQNVAVN
jgi:hypothetical protein